jgi:hypothetical protein
LFNLITNRAPLLQFLIRDLYTFYTTSSRFYFVCATPSGLDICLILHSGFFAELLLDIVKNLCIVPGGNFTLADVCNFRLTSFSPTDPTLFIPPLRKFLGQLQSPPKF